MNSLKDALREKYEEKNKKGWQFIHILAVAPLLVIERNSPFPNILLPCLIIFFLNDLHLFVWIYGIIGSWIWILLRHSPNQDGANKNIN